ARERLARAPGGLDDLEDALERALELEQEQLRSCFSFQVEFVVLVPADLPGDEEQPPVRRGEDAVGVALRLAERRGVDRRELHAKTAPPSRLIPWPLIPPCPGSARKATSRATSSSDIMRFCGLAFSK